MKFKKEVKIAIIVSLIILLFFWGHNFLKGRNLFSAYHYYRAYFEKVDGLQMSNGVTINGFSVGLVSDIRFKSEKLDTLVVEIGVKKSYQIPDNSVMMITSDLLGGKTIALMPGDSPTMADDGATLQGGTAPDLIGSITGSLLPIADKAGQLMNSLDSLISGLQHTFDDETQKNIRNIVANVERLITDERKKISAILTNFESVSSNLQKSNEDISQLIAHLNQFSETLAESDVKNTVDKANHSLSQLNALLSGINEGQGTLGKLAKDDSAYIYLQRSLDDLDKLLVDLRENPRRYVHFSLFGGKKEKK
jgi:phospholipid/cholesterol/gamma-HCH transport system substrate-binding protein